MPKLTFKMRTTNKIFADATGPIEENVGTSVIISGFGSGTITNMRLVEDNTAVIVSVNIDCKFPWVKDGPEFYKGHWQKITCDTQNGISVWTLERVRDV